MTATATSLLLDCLLRSQWALHEPVLRQLSSLVIHHTRGERQPAQVVARIAEERDQRAEAMGYRCYHGGQWIDTDGGHGYHAIEGVAIVPIDGVIQKHARQVNDISQPRGTSCEGLSAAITTAIGDDRVAAILLDVYSPGGAVQGIADLADQLADAGEVKPLVAQVNELAASAAYWLASQAETVNVNQTGEAGSIGVYTVIDDSSRWFSEQGVTVHLVRSGTHKGVGEDGVPVEAEHLEELQRLVDELSGIFKAQVARGRQMSAEQIGELADGRVHIGRSAVEIGLADAVQTFDETLASMIETYGDGSATQVAGLALDTGATEMANKPYRKRRAEDEAEIKAEAQEHEDDEEEEQAEHHDEDENAQNPEEEEESKPLAGDPLPEDEDEDHAEAAVARERTRVASINRELGATDPKLAQQAIEEGWSSEKAMAAYGRKAAKGQAKEPKKPRHDAKPLGTKHEGAGASDEHELIAQRDALIEANPKLSRAQAMKRLASSDPDLFKDYNDHMAAEAAAAA